jgi:hypothetical protein
MKNLIINSPKHGKFEIILDDDVYVWAKKQTINIHKVGGYYYQRISPSKKNLSRIISKCPKGLQVDHINRNTLDNRRCNLRNVTQQENLRNQKRANNKTGYTGVALHKQTGKFTAQLKHNYKKIHLGIFKTIEEAYNARQAGELKYWGAK